MTSFCWLRVSLFCNQHLCFILIFPSQVWCNSVAPWLRTRLFLVGSPPSVTLTTRVIPPKSTLWTPTAPRRASRGSAPGTGDTWPWCPTRSAAPWAGSGPGPRGTSDRLSQHHRGYVCSKTPLPGAATRSDNTVYISFWGCGSTEAVSPVYISESCKTPFYFLWYFVCYYYRYLLQYFMTLRLLWNLVDFV